MVIETQIIATVSQLRNSETNRVLAKNDKLFTNDVFLQIESNNRFCETLSYLPIYAVKTSNTNTKFAEQTLQSKLG